MQTFLFIAEWCEYSKNLAKEAATAYPEIEVVDIESPLGELFDIKIVPAIISLKNAKIINAHIGTEINVKQFLQNSLLKQAKSTTQQSA